jgi:copper homeostasis protein
LILVEAAVETLEDALAAERVGANRIELCAHLSVGGTTPSAALIAEVVAQTRLPVFVMIRPRGGDFIYSSDEIDLMTRDIGVAVSKDACGIVTGALTSDGRVSLERMRGLIEKAAGLPVTFHRAFDVAANPGDALEQVIELGVSRILTSGGATTALQGADAIAALVAQAGRRISIMAGGSVREGNVRELIQRTGVKEVHARLVDEAGMRSTIEAVRAEPWI